MPEKRAQLITATGRTAAGLIFSMRLLPFVPSGLVTFAAAIGRVGLPLFVLASSAGKIPALLIEAYAVNEVTNFGTGGKVILTITALVLLFFAVKRLQNKQ